MLAYESVMRFEGRAHTWRFPGQASQGMPTAFKLSALHSLDPSGPEGADSVQTSRRGRQLVGLGGVGVGWVYLPFIGSWYSLFSERRTTRWVAMQVSDPNILVVWRPASFRDGRELTHYMPACSEGAGACSGEECQVGLWSRPGFW